MATADTTQKISGLQRRPMRTIALRSIAAHKVRLALTVIAVVLGTAFIAGSSMFTAGLSKSFDSIVSSQFDSVDIVVTRGDNPDGVDVADIAGLRGLDKVKSAGIEVDNSSVIVANAEGKRIESGGAPAIASSFDDDAVTAQGTSTLKDGQWPTEPNSVVLNKSAADRGGVKLGDAITILSPTGDRFNPKVVGIYDSSVDTGGFIGAMLDEPTFLEHFASNGHISSVMLSLDEGADKEAVEAAITDAYPTYGVQDAKDLADQVSKMVKKLLSFVNYFLWAFAAIALLVGTFIISNTFSMIVAQRNKEFALLRAIGASRGQITRSVVFEAIVVGLVGSILGIFAGMGIVRILTAVMEARGMGLPNNGIALDTTSILTPIVVGVVVTLLSAWAPARRAASVRPVQAMRSGTAATPKTMWVRTIFGVILTVAGAVAAYAAAMNDGSIKPRVSIVGVSAVAIILGVWLLLPALSIPVVSSLGRVIGLPFGAIGRLASTNSKRNPRRTAATAFALTLGLIMVSSIGMMGATMRSNVEDQIDNNMKAQYMLMADPSTNIPIPSDIPDKVAEVEGVAEQVNLYMAPLTVNDVPLLEYGAPSSAIIRGDLSVAMDMETVSGDPARTDGVELSQSRAEQLGVSEGDIVTVSDGAASIEVPVTWIYSDESSAGMVPGIISFDAASQLVDPSEMMVYRVMVLAEDGTNLKALGDRLKDKVADSLVVQVLDKDEAKGMAGKSINQMLGILYALLALAVIVAILGIVNTLALSVIERRQEIGMLRAVGTQRRQVRVMMYLESVVIALFGAVIGAIVGLGIGWCFVKTMGSQGLEIISVPWGQVGSMIVVSGVVGIIAALWPAASASRTKPLEAITD